MSAAGITDCPVFLSLIDASFSLILAPLLLVLYQPHPNKIKLNCKRDGSVEDDDDVTSKKINRPLQFNFTAFT